MGQCHVASRLTHSLSYLFLPLLRPLSYLLFPLRPSCLRPLLASDSYTPTHGEGELSKLICRESHRPSRSESSGTEHVIGEVSKLSGIISSDPTDSTINRLALSCPTSLCSYRRLMCMFFDNSSQCNPSRKSGLISDELRDNEPKFVFMKKNTFQRYIISYI